MTMHTNRTLPTRCADRYPTSAPGKPVSWLGILCLACTGFGVGASGCDGCRAPGVTASHDAATDPLRSSSAVLVEDATAGPDATAALAQPPPATPPASDDPAPSEASAALNVIAKLATVAGVLRVVDVGAEKGEAFEACEYEVQLGRRVVFHSNCKDDQDESRGEPVVAILKRFAVPIPPFDEVVVFQQNSLGNACNGGPLWMLGLTKDGQHRVSKKIDFCGGRDPVIVARDGSLEITLPGGSGNRGKGSTATERWVYRDGNVMKVVGR
jgi:hypothetical protein